MQNLTMYEHEPWLCEADAYHICVLRICLMTSQTYVCIVLYLVLLHL